MNAIKRPSRVLPVIAATALAVLLAGCYVHPRYTANYRGGPLATRTMTTTGTANGTAIGMTLGTMMTGAVATAVGADCDARHSRPNCGMADWAQV